MAIMVRLNFRQKKGVDLCHARTTTRRMEEPCGDQPSRLIAKFVPDAFQYY
jgi:hypothetical protein